jgi:chemotaxis protein CheD
MDEQLYQVGMAELKVAPAPGKIVTLGLGSCVAVCGYDAIVKVAGIAHVMLPTCPEKGEFNPAKFGNTAVSFLIKKMLKAGANQARLWLKIVGGAQMFSFGSKEPAINIGLRNIQAVIEACAQIGIPISAQNVGGNMGRSVYMDIETGDIEVKTINKGIVHL